MRKIILSLAIVSLLFGGYVFAQTPGNRTGPGDGQLISMSYQNTAPKRFRVVRYLGTGVEAEATSATIAAESIVVWDTVVDDGVTIKLTTISGDTTVAGIIVNNCLTQDTSGNTAAQDRGKDNWTFLQTYGMAEVRVDASLGGFAGGAMGTGTTLGEASGWTSTNAAGIGESHRQGNAGFFMDNGTAGDDDVEVFLKCE